MSRKVSRERRTPYVLLGMLLQGPASGYALRQRIAQSVGNFWQESYGQLYSSLEALAASGLAEASSHKNDGRDTRVWSITKAGRAELARWLARPPAPQPVRNELLLKLFFSELDPAAVTQHLETARAEASAELARLKVVRVEVQTRAADHPALPAWIATVDYGIAGQQALVAWCTQTMRRLTQAERRKGKKRSTRGRA